MLISQTEGRNLILNGTGLALRVEYEGYETYVVVARAERVDRYATDDMAEIELFTDN